jgi:hypothetical protein
VAEFGARRDDQHAVLLNVRRRAALGAVGVLSLLLVRWVGSDELLVRPSDPLERARDEIAVLRGIEIEGLARSGLSGIGRDAAAREEL